MSYNTVIEADEYFANAFGYDKWSMLTDPQKKSALFSASMYLDNLCIWNGEKVDPKQKEAFPRKGVDPVPAGVKIAELEIAYLMVEAGGASVSTSGDDPLTMLKAGSVTLQFDTTSAATASGKQFVNSFVKGYLSPYGQCAFGTTRLVPMGLQ